MFQHLAELNADLAREGQAAVRIGVGLHAGEAIVGYVGSSSRHEYSAIGDVVNVASRLEGLTKDTGYPLVVSASVFHEFCGDPEMVPLGKRAIKGHSPVFVYGWEPGPEERDRQLEHGLC
jgi:adenylate cyclase